MSKLSFAQKTVSLSAVSYTHNDNELLCGALSSIADWTIAPQEIIVVDDASTQPFVPPALPAHLPPVQVLRSNTNLGYAKAKALGINNATKRFIVSFDADVRLSPLWVALCMPKIASPDTGADTGPRIGLVSGPVISKSGSSLFDSYMELTYSLNINVNGEVKFIPGASWLIRRDVWRETGGFNNYTGNAGEDDFLRHNLKNHGYKLWIIQKAQAFEVRPMDRFKMVLRGWKWHGASVKSAIKEGRSLKEAINVLFYSLRDRFSRSLAANVRFLYYDLLYLAHALFDLLESMGERDTHLYFQRLFALWLSPYPRLLATLTKDLEALEHNLSAYSQNNANPLSSTPCPEQALAKPCPPPQENELKNTLEFAFNHQTLTQLNSYIDEITLSK